MATKLPVNVGSDIGAKLWKLHQDNEYTRVNQHKEGLCFVCFSNKAVSATIADICNRCFEKRGAEALLVKAADKFYGMCYFCGVYKFGISQINMRLCQTCFAVVRKHLKNYNLKGGPHGVDPFWLKQRRLLGKDWKILFSDGT